MGRLSLVKAYYYKTINSIQKYSTHTIVKKYSRTILFLNSRVVSASQTFPFDPVHCSMHQIVKVSYIINLYPSFTQVIHNSVMHRFFLGLPGSR